MTETAIGANILLISSVSYLFILFWTKSLKVSICITQMLLTVIAVGVAHKSGYLFVGFTILIISLGTLVWRVVPHNKSDRWSKADV